MRFTETLAASARKNNSLLCVGLDPDPARLPLSLRRQGEKGLYAFCRAIVDATADLVCTFKPQIAYFAACRAENALEDLIAYIHRQYPDIPVILDAKRGDIGATAQKYALEAFERYRADAVTVNPYMGSDSIEPYLDYPEKGVFLLCRTSNPGGGDLQELKTQDGDALFERVARLASEQWNHSGQCGLVVGATRPEEIARVRALTGNLPILAPGIGAQGGDIEAAVRMGKTPDGFGLILNSSRAILYASEQDNFSAAARAVAEATRAAINQYR
ncbi:MAG: orotidine-5'-phosphate decarboxylase [Zoogloeaceae bacterium]|jgi:orotidine-5'-phosphate decarboxylase|nr:orotidine-5'-phosphate decarboxylase [Zoogloeaceae bacterium]